jgi:hypothetical protein
MNKKTQHTITYVIFHYIYIQNNSYGSGVGLKVKGKKKG